MAKPIKETPILRGKDAERFKSDTKRNETSSVSRAEYERVRDSYEAMRKIAKFE